MEAVTHGQDCINNQSFHPNTLSIHVSSIDCSLYTMQCVCGEKEANKKFNKINIRHSRGTSGSDKNGVLKPHCCHCYYFLLASSSTSCIGFAAVYQYVADLTVIVIE